MELTQVPKARPGDKIAVLSPSFAAPGLFPVIHEQSLRAALLTGERLEITDPGESEDVGVDWADPRALEEHGEREATEPWTWAGSTSSVTGRTWGGCIEVPQWILTAGRFPFEPDVLDGAILLLETSEMLIPAQEFGWILRAMGERGLLERVAGVLVARPPTSDHAKRPSREERATLRAEQRDTAIEMIGRYNSGVPIVVGPPFGHTKPQWILPHGGEVTIDGAARRLFADYR